MARVRDNASAGNLVIEGADGVGEALIESQKSRSRTAPLAKPATGLRPAVHDGRAGGGSQRAANSGARTAGSDEPSRRLAERVATPTKYRVLLFGVYLTDDLEHLAPGNRSRIEIALNF
jgi:hypothetical protein